MSAAVEKLEKSEVKLTITVDVDTFDQAIKKVYKKTKNRIQVPGFRRGKAPLKMVEEFYGKEVFFEDAANEVIPDAYSDAVKESDVDVVSRPEINVETLEDGKPFVFTATVAVKPEVTLGEYKGIEVEKRSSEVTDEELQDEINKELEKQARWIDVTDRPVQDGDEADIDFDGYIDGEQFDGGKAEGYKLVIGSHSFIDNFEDQLVGKNIGDETEVNVTFPEEYQVKELAGKPAVFKVKINGIRYKEVPELTDDFVEDTSENDDITTVDQYKDSIRKRLADAKEKKNKDDKEEEVLKKIVENSQMEISDKHIDEQVRQLKQEFSQRLASQGLSLQQYLQFTGSSESVLDEQLRPQALARIQTRLVLEKIAETENIQASEEDVDKEFEDMAKMYNMDKDKVKSMFTEEDLKGFKKDAEVRKAADLVVDAAVEKDA